ncbi:MAG: thiolase [Variovorax sp.]
MSIDVDSTRSVRGRYAIVGVGETPYVRGAGMSTRAMATLAISRALADAGLQPSDIDGMLSYQNNDSTDSTIVAGDLGIRPNFYMDGAGGGSSIEALVGLAIGAIEARLCSTVAIFRSMNGFSKFRFGGSGARARAPIEGDNLHGKTFGWESPAQRFSMSFTRHMHEFGTTREQVAAVKVAHSEHASNNPKALYKRRVTVDDVMASRMICTPLGLLDCCVETDNAAAIIVTSTSRAKDLRQVPVAIRGVVGRCLKPRADMHLQVAPITSGAGAYARDRLWSNSGVLPEEVDVTGAYDAFTFTTLFQLEDFGFCKKGEGGGYVSDGTIRLGGRRPNNTSGGQLCEGYTHGISLVIENVRQLRHDVDDSCPVGADGVRIHTHDYREGGCRQVPNARLAANLGWGGPSTASGLVLERQDC